MTQSDKNGLIGFEVSGRLLNEERREPARGKPGFSLVYQFDSGTVLIAAQAPGVGSVESRPQLVLPLISPTGENVYQPAPDRIEIRKPQGKVVFEANAPLRIQETPRSRIFNLVPGFEAVPIIAEIQPSARLECRIRVGPL